jgi:hypothetical protein
MQGWQADNLHGIEHAEDVEFSFHGQIGCVGEEREGEVHGVNLDAAAARRKALLRVGRFA